MRNQKAAIKQLPCAAIQTTPYLISKIFTAFRNFRQLTGDIS